MDPTSYSSMRSQKSEGKTNNPRDKMLFLLENWDFTLPETKVKILDLYFEDVERQVKEASLNNDTSLLEEELEHAKNLADRLVTEFARHKIHGYIIQRERKRAFKGLLEIECFILDITEKSIYVSEDHKDWISGIATKNVSRGDLLELHYKVSIEEARFHECLLKWGMGGKPNEEKGPPSPMKKPIYDCKKDLEKYTSMDDNEKRDGYIAKKRGKYMVLEANWKKECRLFNMVMEINRKYNGLSYTLKAQAMVSLLSDTIESKSVV